MLKTKKSKSTKHPQIIYAFIDSQNLHLGVKSQGWYLDWRKFRQYLRNKYNVTKAFTSGLLRKYNNFVVRVDLLKKSLEIKKAKISGRSRP